jgi:hypothetical protein
MTGVKTKKDGETNDKVLISSVEDLPTRKWDTQGKRLVQI